MHVDRLAITTFQSAHMHLELYIVYELTFGMQMQTKTEIRNPAGIVAHEHLHACTYAHRYTGAYLKIQQETLVVQVTPYLRHSRVCMCVCVCMYVCMYVCMDR